MNEYKKQALDFLKKNNIRFSQAQAEIACPDWDNGNAHYMHKVRFYNRNTGKSMLVRFFSSIDDYNRGNDRADAYSVLACLQKYDVGSIDDFVHEFGYEVNSWKDVRRIEKTYRAVTREYRNVMRVFADCIEELREIN